MHGQVDGHINRGKMGQMDGWMDGWKERRMDRWADERKSIQLRETSMGILPPIIRIPLNITLRAKPAFKTLNSKLKFIHDY